MNMETTINLETELEALKSKLTGDMFSDM